jgi:HAD superfamily hydrolase (TIGR01490 family)
MQLALFDLDHTLLPLDSDFEWSQFLIRLGVLDGPSHTATNQRFYDQYVAGTLDMQAFLAFALAPLAAHPMRQLQAWHAQYMREVISPAIRPAAQTLVDQHRDAGDLCVLVTATNEFVTAPIARAFGIPHLVATGIERGGNGFTGRPEGEPCFREGKITNLERFLAQRGTSLVAFERSTFYSDSANDIPLMSCVTHPVATNPDARLSAHAAQANWPVLQLFAPKDSEPHA